MTVATDTAARLRRLLAIVTWLAQVEEAPIEEAAARFGLTPEVLVAELEMAACCGLPPYTPDQLTEILVTDTSVSARVGDALTRPRRLTATEGFALATAARALLAVPGSDEGGALSRALAKLEAALGAAPVVVELDAPSALGPVRQALESGGALEIEYYSAGSDRVSRRRIEPRRVFAAEGHWYTDAWCHAAGGLRRFRLDRISALWPAEERGDPRDGAETDAGTRTGAESGTELPEGFAPFVPGPEARTVHLSLPRTLAARLEGIPTLGPPAAVGDRLEVDVAVGGEAWLARLLLHLGEDAEVVRPAELAGLRRQAAERILARYRDA